MIGRVAWLEENCQVGDIMFELAFECVGSLRVEALVLQRQAIADRWKAIRSQQIQIGIQPQFDRAVGNCVDLESLLVLKLGVKRSSRVRTGCGEVNTGGGAFPSEQTTRPASVRPL